MEKEIPGTELSTTRHTYASKVCIRLSGNRYEIYKCIIPADGKAHCKRLMSMPREVGDDGVEYSAAGGIRRALPGMDMYDIQDSGVFIKYVARILSQGKDYLEGKIDEDDLLAYFKQQMSSYGRGSERITKKLEKTPQGCQEILGKELENFNSSALGLILKQAEQFPPEVKSVIMDMLGFGEKKLCVPCYTEGLEPLVQPNGFW